MYYDTVIIGGGAGGLELASKLGRALGRKNGPEKVLLIDRSPFHIWKPTLHEVAAGTLNPQQEGLSYSILARSNHFSFVLGELVKFQPENKTLSLQAVYHENGEMIIPERLISFNRCVLALGSGSNFFGTPGSEHAYVLENAQDAQNFHTHLLNLFAKAAYSADKSLNVVIVGGGATGVELSAEMMEAYHEIQNTVGSEQRFRIQITLIEAAPRILAGLPEKVSAQATQALRQKQIKVLSGTKVTEIFSNKVETDQCSIPVYVVLWAAGIKAADRNREYGLPVNRINQFEVNDQLQTPFDGVYALGDCAACPWEDGKLVPARAQAAHQEADFLCILLLSRIEGKAFDQTFRYKDSGSLVSLGNNHGVGNLIGSLSGGSFFIEGLIAKYMYMSLHLLHHKTILCYVNSLLLALARIMQQRVSGRLKLH